MKNSNKQKSKERWVFVDAKGVGSDISYGFDVRPQAETR